MDSSSTEEQTVEEEEEEEAEVIRPVEITVETEAEAGASGYSVTGGGQKGIFIKDVLKDSPAAKHLSLRQGDQLLSAKVYFDNVKYEDALKILQCAEPYKVSFLVKRMVPGGEVIVRPAATSLEVKGPKAKVPKMSVKSTKPFKLKKMRGGRFGLKRLKERRGREELVIEGTPPRVDISDVDVEFCLPKMKQRSGIEATADGTEGVVSGKRKKRIRFPKMRAIAHNAGATEVEIRGPLEGDVDVSGTKVKSKVKGPKFGITFPKTKSPTSDSSSAKGSVEFKPPEVNLQPPSVEFCLSGNGSGGELDVERGGAKFNTPEVEFSLPSGKAEASLPNVPKSKVEIKAPEVDMKGDINVKGLGGKGKVPKIKRDADVGKGDGKLRMPKMKLPKVRLSCHSDEIDGDLKIKAESTKMPDIEIAPPTVDVDFSLPTMKGNVGGDMKVPTANVKGGLDGGIAGMEVSMEKPAVKMPSVDISLPKGKGKSVSHHAKGEIKMPGIDVSVPGVSLDLDTGRRVHDEIEGPSFKGPNISTPKADISLPKTELPQMEFQTQERGIQIDPSVDISPPKSKLHGGDVEMEHYMGGDGRFKMPEFDISLPKMHPPKGEVKIEGQDTEVGFKLPKVGLNLPKGKLKGDDDCEGEGAAYKLPSFNVVLPNVKGDVDIEGHAEVEGPTMKGNIEMPDTDVSLPNRKADGGKKIKGKGKFKKPKCDASIPTMNLPKGDLKLKGPDIQGNISLPEGKGDADFEAHGGEGGQFHMPSIDLSLPKMKVKGPDVNIEGPEVKGGKFAMPSLDISLPKVNLPEGNIKLEGPDMKGKLEMPDVDISLSKGKAEGHVEFGAHAGKGGKFHMPSMDLSLPKMKAKGPEVKIEGPEVKGGKFALPSFDVSLPKVTVPGGNVEVEGPDMKGKVELPDFDISLPKGKAEGEINVEGKGGKFKMPKFDVSLPKVNFPEGDFKMKGPDLKGKKIEMPDIDISLPKGKAEGDIDIDAHGDKGGKFHMPSIDLSLPKMKVKGPDVNIEGPEVKGGKFGMTSLDISLPKVNLPGGNVKVEGPDMKGKVELPDVAISLPKGKAEGEINVEGKGGKFKMPKFDVSLPKVNLTEGDFKIKGPNLKGKKTEIPDIDISLPKGKAEGDIDIEARGGKGGKFHMPSIDLSLPKMKVKGPDINNEGPEVKGGKFAMPSFDVSIPKVNIPEGTGGIDADLSLKGDLKGPKVKVKGADVETEGKGRKILLPTVKLPKVDISPPKVDFDFGLAKPKTDDVELSLLKAEGGRPSSGSSFEMPDVSLKLPRFSLPKFGGRPKSGELDVEGQIPKGDITLSPPEGEIRAPSVEFDDGDGNVKVKVNKPKIKMPSFGISKKTSDTSVSCPEGDADATLEGEMHKVGFHAPNVTIKLPKFSGFGSKEGSVGKTSGDLDTKAKVKMPAVELSLPATKAPDTEVLLPKVEVDVSEDDIRGYEGKLKIPKMPTIDVSAPKTETDMGMSKVERGGFKIPHFGLPDINISVPKGNSAKIKRQEMELKGSGELDVSDVEIDRQGQSKFNMPHVKIPNVDITLPKVKIGKAYTPDVDLKDTAVEGKALLTDINSGVEIEGKKGKLTMPQIKMPNVDITLPQVKSGKNEGPDVEMEMKGTGGGRFKMPNVNISLPQGKVGRLEQPGVDLDAEGEEHNLKMPGIKVTSHLEGPDAKVSMPSMKSKEDEEGLTFKTPQIKMPIVDISLPKGKTGGFEPSDKMVKGGKLKGPDVKLPSAHISIPEVTGSDLRVEGTKGKKKMELPDIELSTPETSGQAKGTKVKGTKFKIGMPKMKKSAEVNVEIKKGGKGKEIEGMSGQMDVSGSSNGESDLSLPKEAVKAPSIPEIDFDISASQEVDSKMGKGQKFKIPKFGVALPYISSPERRLNVHQTDIHYETLPKVKKAMFVLVDPEAEEPAMSACVPGKEGSVNLETGDATVRIPKIKMKPTFGKTDAKDKVALQVEGSSSGLDGEKDFHIESKNDKTKTGGKIKLPKVVFSSPYTKMGGAVEEDTEVSAKLVTDSPLEGTDAHVKGMMVKSSKTSFAGFSMTTSGVDAKEIPETEERGDVVKSPARTDMLDRDSSESHGYSMGFTSSKFQEWEETQGTEATEASSWFKVPKFSLKPHSTGFLQITPEGSPRAQRRSEVSDEVGGEAGVSGMFSLHSPAMDFGSSQVSEQHHVSTVQEGSVTMVTKTTRTTRQLVTTETRTGEGSVTTTTRRVLDYEQ